MMPAPTGLLAVTLLLLPMATQVPSVRGEVVELACHLEKGAGGRGEAHAACAMACARKGNPMAILADDAVYIVEGDFAANGNAKLLDFVAKRVEAKGQVTEKDGRQVINVTSMALLRQGAGDRVLGTRASHEHELLDGVTERAGRPSIAGRLRAPVPSP